MTGYFGELNTIIHYQGETDILSIEIIMVLSSEIFRINNKAIIELGRFRMISRIMATSFPGSSPTLHPERERERPPSVIHAINVICQYSVYIYIYI